MPEPTYNVRSAYISMPDETKIAVDICLPVQCDKAEKVPVLVEFTRYWRCCENHPPKPRPIYFASLGLAHALVDCRGSGASFGIRQAEQSVQEVRDFFHVINWLAEQSWCNGSVVSIGVSYSANTAELAMVDAPPALKASIPRFSDFDAYAHLFFPGGLRNKAFIDPWGKGIQALDSNNVDETVHQQWSEYRFGSVKPVDTDRSCFQEAIEQHSHNYPLLEYLADVECRDDFHFADNLNQENCRWVNPCLIQTNCRVKQIPSYHCASFNDAGTAAGAIARFLHSSAPMRVVIGYWSHGGLLDTNPLSGENQRANPDYEAHFDDIAHYLAGLNSNEGDDKQLLTRLDERALYYFTAGTNQWRKTDCWPPKGTKERSWYFDDDFSLTQKPPENQDAKDSYKVDFDIGTGEQSCWNQMVPEVQYGDRAAVDRRLLCYTSKPLTNSLEITGTPVISLHLSSNQSDGAVIIYLEMVAPDGVVTVLTEGCFRLIHRRVASELSPYPVFSPYHSFESKDAVPMPIGKCESVIFELLPFSVRVEAHYSLRVAIAGHDKDTFERVAPEGDQHYVVYRSSTAMSCINLPMREIVGTTKTVVADNPFAASLRVNNAREI